MLDIVLAGRNKAMTIELARDIVIIIYGVVGTIFFIALLVLIFSSYRQIKVIQNSIGDTLSQIHKLIAESRESLKSIAPIIGMINAISTGIDLVRKIVEIKKEGGKTNDQ
jgi:hypothetical protein